MGKTSSCKDLDDNLTSNIKKQLENLYKNVTSFEKVEIVNFVAESCSSNNSRRISKRQTVSSRVAIEHYCVFANSVKNQTKLNLLNILQDFLLTSQKIGSLELNEAFIIDQNGSKILLNNSCSIFNYLQVCENKGICQEDNNSKPRCVCPSKSTNENFYWSGNYCDVKIASSSNSDQIKMYTTIGVLATFAIVSLLALIVYIIYKKRKQKEIIKRVLSEKSKTNNNNGKTSTSTNHIDYPRPNGNSSHLKPNMFPHDLVISSQPKTQLKSYFGNDRKKKSKESNKKTDANKSKFGQPIKVEVPIELNLNSHVNYAYDNEILFDAMKPGELKGQITMEKSSMNPYYAKNDRDHEFFQSNSQTHSDDFLIESQLQNFQLGRRESAQHIPQSFERQMAKNFQNLTTNSSPTGSYSLDTSIETSNQNSKYTDSTSICTDHSLKDEDAWMPILNIAEEEILKYKAEEARGTEFCLI